MKHELMDVSFLILINVDSKERHENLQVLHNYLTTYFSTNIWILEVGRSPKVQTKFLKGNSANYEFIHSFQSIFHMTKYRNYLTRKARTEIVFQCDSDVIASPLSIIEAVKILKHNKKAVAYPYNGLFYQVADPYRSLFGSIKDYKFLQKYRDHFSVHFTSSVGGIFGINRTFYMKCGLENEKIVGWGPDDRERYVRFKKANAEICRTKDPLFHLSHPIYSNSRAYSNSTKEKNHRVYLHTLAIPII